MVNALFSIWMSLMTLVHPVPNNTHQSVNVPGAVQPDLICEGPGCYGSDPRCDGVPDACR